MKDKSQVVIIGYSGHSFVACDIFISQNISIEGYCEEKEKDFNPYNLIFLGKENADFALDKIKTTNYFTAIGNNKIRQEINTTIQNKINSFPINAIHKNASISTSANLGNGIMIGDGCIINACSTIGDGVICNTQAVIEHECIIGHYSHIAPGAVLCGNVKVGEQTFIGAKSVVREGVKIGNNVIIGAGTVIIKDIPDNSKVVGSPQRFI
ncbi:acetyltransferase [Saprospiraceae bacterium]|nr:acetyltransferase [Saprospiraceae bacterium]